VTPLKKRRPRPRWDVFISHASEDKASVARPLAELLRAHGLRVWYDEFTLTIGDSLSRSIDRGLLQSRFGVVILSPDFFRKRWPAYELRGLLAKEISGRDLILPVWHNTTAAEVRAYSLPIADKLSLSTASDGIEVIAHRIVQKVRPGAPPVATHWIATFGVSIPVLREDGHLPADAPEDYAALCDWLTEGLLADLQHAVGSGRTAISDLRVVEDQRDDETLSVRIAFQWKPSRARLEFGVDPIWELLEVRPAKDL
jgi:hypothetical protein